MAIDLKWTNISWENRDLAWSENQNTWITLLASKHVQWAFLLHPAWLFAQVSKFLFIILLFGLLFLLFYFFSLFLCTYFPHCSRKSVACIIHYLLCVNTQSGFKWGPEYRHRVRGAGRDTRQKQTHKKQDSQYGYQKPLVKIKNCTAAYNSYSPNFNYCRYYIAYILEIYRFDGKTNKEKYYHKIRKWKQSSLFRNKYIPFQHLMHFATFNTFEKSNLELTTYKSIR